MTQRAIGSTKSGECFPGASCWFPLILLVLLSAGSAGCATTRGENIAKPAAGMQSVPLEERFGVRVLGVQRSAAGYMLDFRYRVTDPEKASPLFVRQTKPYLIDEGSGARFAVFSSPKTGPMRTSDPPKADRNYFILFGNPGRYVKPGNKVTVVIGEFRAENLVVQ